MTQLFSLPLRGDTVSGETPLEVLRTSLENGDYEHALAFGQAAVALDEGNASLWLMLGSSFHMTGNWSEAARCFKTSVDLDGSHAEAWSNLAAAHMQQGQAIEAFEAACKALSIKEESAQACMMLGLALYKLGQAEVAIEAFEAALVLEPEDAFLHHQIGLAHNALGDFEAAERSFLRALRLDPHRAESHLRVAMVHAYCEGDDHLAMLLSLYEQSAPKTMVRSTLCFALATAFEKLERFEEAYTLLREGNAIYKSISGYDISRDRQLFDQIKKAGTELAQAGALRIKKRERPEMIFVMGLPRSGTSLLEQMLGAHSDIFGAGELHLAEKFGQDLALGRSAPNAKTLREFRENYMERVQKISGDASYVVDKMPHNFCYLAAIAQAFPDAKIIVAKRDARAVLWSNYRQPFLREGLGYSHDFNDLCGYHDLYCDLMSHWESHFGDRLITCDYDQMVGAPETYVPLLFEQLGLDWQDACLSPEVNRSAVRTASSTQLRAPITKELSQRWQRYAPFLDGAFDGVRNEMFARS